MSLEERVAVLERAKQTLIDDVEKVTGDVQALKLSMQNHTNITDTLQDRVHAVDEGIRDLKTEVAALTTGIHSAHRELESLQQSTQHGFELLQTRFEADIKNLESFVAEMRGLKTYIGRGLLLAFLLWVGDIFFGLARTGVI